MGNAADGGSVGGSRVGRNLLQIATLVFLTAAGAVAAAGDGADTAGAEFFEKRIRPILVENCYQCHGPKKRESGLALSSFAGQQKGGDRGPPIVAGKPDESLLIQAVRYADDDLKMPPRGKLKDEQIAELVSWVKMGAPRPKEDVTGPTTVRPSGDFNLADRRKHWAYQPVQRVALPAGSDTARRASPIDCFILSRLEKAGLSPAPPADQRTLIRRVAFDLTGLPPTPAEVAAFLDDPSPDTYERLVDRLLASPQYGERWARHWLDVIRYSETLGFEFDYDIYHAWRYRDYVIRAFNADLPYDQFVVEHLAGDLLPEQRNATEGVPYSARRHPLDGCNESILATGFFWMLEGKQTPVDIRQEQADRIDNQIDTLGKAFLGQTIACARCHDHKFDALSTRDYYALAGYLKSSRYQQAFIDPPERIGNKVRELADLKREIREQTVAKWSAAWRTQLSQAGHYLLAASHSEPEKAAQQFGLESTRLQQWVKALQKEDAASPDHPLNAWAKLSRPEKDAAASLPQRYDQLPAALREQSDKAAGLLSSAKRFADFHRSDFGGWYVSGDAFGNRPATVGEFVIGEQPERPVARLTTGGVDSGLLSTRLQGELRSPSFTIDKRFVHLRLAGSKARVNLVIDGYTLIMNPIYGKLTATPTSNLLTWRTMPVDRWLGHRAYFEVSDCMIPMHGLNPPPSTARVPESKGDGYIVFDQALLSDDPDPPVMPNRLNSDVLSALHVPPDSDGARSVPPTMEALAARYQQLMVEQVERWRAATLASNDQQGADGIALVNWLLENGLLDAPSQASERFARYRQLEAALPLPERAPALADGTGEDEFVFLRGNYRTLGEPAHRGPPEVLISVELPRNTTEGTADNAGSGRLDLARRLVAPSNPLLPRVVVNRLWQHHFGEGLVRTPDDFGRMGQPPSHPELLDYLAAELVTHGWSLKDLNRQMVTSSTYRLSSGEGFRVQGSEQLPLNPEPRTLNPLSVDPENRLLSHIPIHRLEAEAIRDSILSVSGRLDLRMHGASVLPFVTPYMEGRGKPSTGALDGEGRRSIYLNARRNFLTPLLLAFDYPVTFTPIGRRGTSTIPAQALSLMNDPFVVQQASEWASRAIAEGGSPTERRIENLYQTAFARPPSDQEVGDAIDFLQQQSLRHGTGSDDPRVWADLCHVLINVKEFIFVE